MNISVILGLTIAVAVVYFGAIKSVSDPKIFLDLHAIILVLGGTLAAALIAFPMRKIFGLLKILITKVILNQNTTISDVVKEIIDAAPLAKTNPTSLANRKAPHPFIEEGYQLIAEGVLSEHELKEVLTQRSLYFKKDYTADAKVWLALSKFPPAFGLLGASSGMIAMMANLESQKNNVGAAMAVALVATFWGIAFANLVLLPLSDYYQKLTVDDYNMRCVVVEGLMMLKRKESPLVVVEKLNSHLPLHERISSSGSSRAAA
jgi:chemotaxis protein MotA